MSVKAIVVEINGQELSIPFKEAEKLYQDLHQMLGYHVYPLPQPYVIYEKIFKPPYEITCGAGDYTPPTTVITS